MAKPAESKRRTAAGSSPGQPPHLQVAALCWRRSPKGLRILLITSRDTGRWVIPKGWPMRRRSGAQAAAREAFEEAGLQGEIASRSIGIYRYVKALGAGRTVACAVQVYPLEVRAMVRNYPETGQRRSRWFAPAKAARRVAEPDLAALIRDFDPDAPDEPGVSPAAAR